MKTQLKNYGTLLLAVLLTNSETIFAETAPKNMSWIPAGNFVMGDTWNDGSTNELPLHTVYVDAFYVDKYEVTQALWQEVYLWATTNGYSFDNYGSVVDSTFRSRGTNHPVHTINWYDAVKWCNARSEKELRTPAYYTDSAKTNVYRTGRLDLQTNWVNWNTGYRLPTEAEWEKSARGGNGGHRFPWKNTDTITHSNANYYSSSNHSYDISPTRGHHPVFGVGLIRFTYTSPVGYFEPNDYGLYDMAGNVMEWCWDWYGAYASGSQTNPLGGTFISSNRIVRGGDWGSIYERRVANREYFNPQRSYLSYPSFKLLSFGFRTVLPSSLPYEILEAMNTPSTQEVYSCSITRQPGKDSLVIITHGWIPKKIGQTSPPNPDWVDEMANQIRANLTSRELNNWQVETFKWKERAWRNFAELLSGEVLENAEKEGGNLGDCVGSQGWSHIHIIGHSAGAAVVQAATLNIKSANINTVVHATFLDPYVGGTYRGRSKYGFTADWADNYFAFDLNTFDGLIGRTDTKLDHAYNVDVIWLDPNKKSTGTYRSTSEGEIAECFETVSSHGWPHDFYANTIYPYSQQGSQGFGFLLSKEGGGWDFATSNYSTYTDPIRVLGTPDAPCPLGHDLSIPVYPPWLMNFNQTPSITSDTGSVENNGLIFILSGTGTSASPSKESTVNSFDSSSTPAWLVTVLAVTNKINFVSFGAQFMSTNGAEGILSVYWNTNQIGTIDERVVVSGLRHYTYSLPQNVTNGTHTLGFRLDSFTATTSSIEVTNVMLGFVGISDPFNLSVTGKDTNGFVMFQLTGPTGFNYSVETSTNLIDWQTMAVLINTNGVVPFVDRQSTNSTAKFYRAFGY